jgi:glycosyltransferase involved in cell wall biosynthesis
MTPLTICFISHSSGTGGAERVLLESIEALKQRGAECRVLLPERGELCLELDKLGVPFAVVSFPLWMSRGRTGPLQWLKAAFGTLINTVPVAWRIHSWKCDLVYSNTVTVCAGAIAARLLRLPHLWHLHEFGMEDQGLSFLFGDRISYAIVDNFSERCVCVSQVLAQKYRKRIDPEKIVVIYPSMRRFLGDDANRDCNKSDYDNSANARNRGFRCVIAGALMEGKGQEDGVRAMAHLTEAGVKAELLIVGEGVSSYKTRLEALVASNGLEAQVTFVGKVKNAFPIMRSSDAVLVCSKSEAFGRVTVEGMLARKPVIGARAGATAELIKDGITGLLYTPGDARDLARQIQHLCDNPAVAETLAKAGQQWAEKCFTAERYGNEVMAALPGANRLLKSRIRRLV